MKGHISFKARLLMGFGAIIVLMIVLMAMALMQFFNSRTGLVELRDVISPKAWAAEKMALDIIQVQQFLTDVSATHNAGGYEEAEEHARDFKKTIEQFHKNKLTNAEAAELASIDQAFDEYYQVGKRMAEAYISSGIQGGNVLMEEFDKTSLILAERMGKFRETAVGQSNNVTSQMAQAAEDTTNFMLVLVVLGALASAFIAFYLTQVLAKQLGIDPFYAKGLALEIAKGELGRIIEIDASDNSSLLFAMKKMQQEIIHRITTAQKLIDEVTRIKIALDNVSTGVMIADNDRKIIYVNKAVVKQLKKIESELKGQLPGFSIDNIIGRNID
ncbi:MAG: PAS domain-containing protein, partial [Methylococcales bacterium]